MLDTLKSTYKLNKRIKDDTFNTELISDYNLHLQINSNLFRVCVTDSEKNRCMLLEDYQLSSVLFPEQLIEQLELIYEDHTTLKAGFWRSIRLAVKNTSFSLIPESLFDKQFLKEYLNLNCALKEEPIEEILFYKQDSTSAVNIFSADKKVMDWFSSVYPQKSVKFVHHTSPMIEGVMKNYPQKDQKSMFIQVEDNYLTILVTRHKTLEFCNTFYFTTPDDFVYYIMFVYEQLQLNPDYNHLTIWGEIVPDSAIYNKLFKYIRNISFGQKPNSIYFGYHFDEIMDHRFFDLYSMHFCE